MDLLQPQHHERCRGFFIFLTEIFAIPMETIMHTAGSTTVETLSQYVTFIKELMQSQESGIYPVLGAHGSEFFIELATGAKSTRDILLNIVIEFGEIHLDFDTCQKAIANRSDVFMNIPDSAHLIALLGLLEKAFKDTTKILHPLNSTGNYLPAWDQAISNVSFEKPF